MSFFSLFCVRYTVYTYEWGIQAGRLETIKRHTQSQHKHSYLHPGCEKDIFGNTLATPVVSHHQAGLVDLPQT